MEETQKCDFCSQIPFELFQLAIKIQASCFDLNHSSYWQEENYILYNFKFKNYITILTMKTLENF